MTTGLETEWDYSSRKGRDGQKKKIGKANERKEKVKRGKDEEVNGHGGRGVPRSHTGAVRAENIAINILVSCAVYGKYCRYYYRSSCRILQPVD